MPLFPDRAPFNGDSSTILDPNSCLFRFSKGFHTKFQKLGFICTIEQLPQLLERLQSMRQEEFKEHEAVIVSFRSSHLMFHHGILNQISLFMKGEGVLECGPSSLHPGMIVAS